LEKLELKLGKYEDDANLEVLHVELVHGFTNRLVWRIVEQEELCLSVTVISVLSCPNSVLEVACECYALSCSPGDLRHLHSKLNYA